MPTYKRALHLERTFYQVSDKNQWVVKAAKTIDEASKLTRIGFE
jgi:hypothetical protein